MVAANTGIHDLPPKNQQPNNDRETIYILKLTSLFFVAVSLLCQFIARNLIFMILTIQ